MKKICILNRFYRKDSILYIYFLQLCHLQEKTKSPKSDLPTRFIYVSIFIPFLESTTFIFSIFHPFLIRFCLKICCRTTIPITYSSPKKRRKGEEKNPKGDIKRNFSSLQKIAMINLSAYCE